MDKLSVLHHKSLKQAKAKKKQPIKVVYISNPMHVEATAAQFLPLVQKLTGRDSDSADVASDYFSMRNTADANPTAPAAVPVSGSGLAPAPDPGVGAHYEQQPWTFEMFDDALLASAMLENFQGFVPAAKMFYETSPHGHVDEV